LDPLISICIPVYNGGAYLSACLDTVLAQSFADYEIIVVDDGSTDDSAALIETYRQNHPAIRCYQNEKNLGLVGNWNRCLELANGQWIKFVFQDDLLAPDCLHKLMQAAADSQALVVCERAFKIEENASSELKKYFKNEVLTLEKIYDGHVPGFIPAKDVSVLGAKYLCLNFIGEPTAVLFKRTLAERLGPFDPNLKQICDLEYFLRIATQYGLKYVHEPLVSFRVHAGSTTSANLSEKKFGSLFSDPGIFSYKLLHDPLFKRFRHSISWLQQLKIGYYFKLKVYEAHLFLEKNQDAQTVKQAALLKQYPGFETGKKPGIMTNLIYFFVLQKRKK